MTAEAGRMTWEICEAHNWDREEREKLAELLEEGWEPFAVSTSSYGNDNIWLRRQLVSIDPEPDPGPISLEEARKVG